MTKTDDVFKRRFLVILGLLVLFTLIVFGLARLIGSSAFERQRQDPADVAERIAPVGQVRIAKASGAAEQSAASATAPAASAAPATTGQEGAEEGAGPSGEKVFKASCMACHATGVAGAPKAGDRAAWEPRAAQGLDTLVGNALKGKGAMPPKGGNPTLGEDEIRAAIRYMLEQSGLAGG